MLKRLILLLLLTALSGSVFAQRFNQKSHSYGARDSRFEASLLIAYQNGASKEVEGGSSLDIDSDAGWGLTVGWNWTEHFNLAYKLSVNNPDYSATIVFENPDEATQTINYGMSKNTHQFNATYHFLDRSITPFVQVGLGLTTLDSNIPESPPSTGCWWDPWWGYVCTTTWSTYKATEFSYNLGLGLRWDVNNALFLRGSYNKEWVKVKSGTMGFNTLTLEAGLMF